MKITTPTFLVCVSLLGGVALAYKDINIKDKIVQECLSRLPDSRYDHRSGIYKPVSYTLESFISLVEKIEQLYPQHKIFELTNMLLERFYFILNYQSQGSYKGLVLDEKKRHRIELLQQLMGPRQGESDVKDFFGDLNDNERCSLYFMIAHNINDTYRKDYDMMGDPEHSQTDQSKHPLQDVHAKYPREQGLVSLHSDSVNAVAMGRVLVGIAAGQHKGNKKKLNDLGKGFKAENQDRELEIVAALTIADAVAYAEEMHEGNLQKYGPPGSWNKTSFSCQTEYKLKAVKYTTTDAEMRGSIDGYLLGQHVKELERTHGDELTLSRLLRMFYSRRGIPVERSKTVGFCFRDEARLSGQDEELLKENVENAYIFYNARKNTNALKEWTQSYNDYFSRNLLDGEQRGDFCRGTATEVEKGAVETPVDIFVVLDVSEIETTGLKEQIDVLGHLAGYLDIGNGGGKMTVLFNSRSGVNEESRLEMINSNNTGRVTCSLVIGRRSNQINNLQRSTVAETLEDLNKALTEHKNRKETENGVPAKVVIYFHYDIGAKEDDNKLNDASRALRYGHRDVQVIAIGTGDPVLEKIATHLILKDIQQPKDRAHQLMEKIKKVPALLQYHECEDRRYRGEENHIYHGYVTPGDRQLLAMYPEYFLKSFNIEFRFKSTNGKIRVCYDRGLEDPSDNCHDIDAIGKEHVVKISNPCEGRTKENCSPFNFAIIGVKSTDGSFFSSCTDVTCRRFDQIQFTISHKGVACSSAFGLLASPLMLFAVIYAALRNLV